MYRTYLNNIYINIIRYELYKESVYKKYIGDTKYKVKIPSPKSEFVKKAFVILVTGILPFSLIVNKQNEDSSK